MPDSFFASSKSRKRKRPQTARNGSKKPKLDEELSDQHSSGDEWGGIQDMDLRAEEPDPGASGDEDEDETPAEKRLRLAQVYLNSIKESLADGEYDAAEIDKEIISARLKQDILSHSGKIHLFIADSFSSLFSSTSTSTSSTPTSTFPTLRTRGHRFSVTSAVTSPSSKYLFTSGKEGTIIKWSLATGKKLATLHKSRLPQNLTSFSTHASTSPPAKSKPKAKPPHPSTTAAAAHPQGLGHTNEVLALALSSDGKYLASGGRDRRLIVWDADTLTLLKSFQGPMNHKDVISALSFRHSTYQLFTASFDRTIKLYDLSPSVMGYTETLFGHQDSILSLSSLNGHNCVSVGGRDITARYWKIVEESQLVFRGGGGGGTGGGKGSKVREILEGGLGIDGDEEKEKGREAGYAEGSLECIAMIDESTFVTGGNSGSISLWSTQKKKPVFTYPLAHGLHQVQSSTEGLLETPRWITALAALPYSDLFVSGSWDGQIRLWKLDSKLKSFSLLGGIPIPGVINSLQLTSPPKSFFISLLPPPPPPPLTTSNGSSAITSSSRPQQLQPSTNAAHTVLIDVSTSTATASLPADPISTSTPTLSGADDMTSNSIESVAKSNYEQPNSESRTSWLHTHPHFHSYISSTSTLASPAVLVIAGVGQEHRFGRWLSVKEGGTVNGAYVVALLPCLSLDNSTAVAGTGALRTL